VKIGSFNLLFLDTNLDHFEFILHFNNITNSQNMPRLFSWFCIFFRVFCFWDHFGAALYSMLLHCLLAGIVCPALFSSPTMFVACDKSLFLGILVGLVGLTGGKSKLQIENFN